MDDMNPNRLKIEAMDNVLSNGLIPNEGETINIYGGRGNRIIYQCKKEKGLFYRRVNESEEWEEFDLMGIHLKVLRDMTNNLYREFDKEKRVGFAARLKRILKGVLG